MSRLACWGVVVFWLLASWVLDGFDSRQLATGIAGGVVCGAGMLLHWITGELK